jgi:hypothetical protein
LDLVHRGDDMMKLMWSHSMAFVAGGWVVWELIRVRQRRRLGESWPLILTGFSDNKKDAVIQIAVVLGFVVLTMWLLHA